MENTTSDFKEMNDRVYDVLKKHYIEDPDSLTGSELAILTGASLIRAAEFNEGLNQLKVRARKAVQAAERLIEAAEKGEYNGNNLTEDYLKILPAEAADIALYQLNDVELARDIYKLDYRFDQVESQKPLPPGLEV